jgi:hypothetical protein
MKPHTLAKPLRASLAAIAGLVCLCLSVSAEASGRGSLEPSIYAPAWRHEAVVFHAPRHERLRTARASRQFAPDWRHGAPVIAAQAAWGGASALASEAARYVGSGKFTSLPGPWCADAVNAWLRGVGKPALGSRYAGAALSYGPRGSGSPGELAVFMGRRGAYHVGVVVASLGDRVEVVSGNWSHRVGRAVVPRRSLVFVRT